MHRVAEPDPVQRQSDMHPHRQERRGCPAGQQMLGDVDWEQLVVAGDRWQYRGSSAQ